MATQPGAWIKGADRRDHLSQEQLAAKFERRVAFETSQGWFIQMERGEAEPSSCGLLLTALLP